MLRLYTDVTPSMPTVKSNALITLTPSTARRLAITRQHLTAPTPAHTDANTILDVVRDLGCLQLDPTSAVARSHLLVLWSRFGTYDPSLLDQLLWQERKLFEYWAHAASIVLTEDFPIHQWRMRNSIHGSPGSVWNQRVRDWMEQNAALRRHILMQLRKRGPLPLRELEDRSQIGWKSSGWTAERNVQRMLDFLWWQGRVMVARRAGSTRYWDLAERCLPDWTPRQKLPSREVTLRAAQRSLRALGVATPKQIEWHFTRHRYPDLKRVLHDLSEQEVIVPVQIKDDDEAWRGDWFVHQADIPLVEQLARGEWHGRTTLLSPFDNLICDRDRTEQLWDFYFRIAIYTPKAQRVHGYFVMPILHRDHLIGRMDPKMDRAKGELLINSVHLEPTAPRTPQVARAVRNAVEDLARFLGATAIHYQGVPSEWAKVLR
ncbi:MAG: winged helix DNA-binding domain-containing protein [Chloroflexi bacterium]|nr:winged helix DNA-binding domain-containing protein [Chloroflexota bacterium]